jgi:hypothetical protein
MEASDPYAVTIAGRLLIPTEGWNRVICPHAKVQDWRNSLPVRARRDNIRLRILTRPRHRPRQLSRAARSSSFVNGAPSSGMPPTEVAETTGREECRDICLSRVAWWKQGQLTFRTVECHASTSWGPQVKMSWNGW